MELQKAGSQYLIAIVIHHVYAHVEVDYITMKKVGEVEN